MVPSPLALVRRIRLAPRRNGRFAGWAPGASSFADWTSRAATLPDRRREVLQENLSPTRVVPLQSRMVTASNGAGATPGNTLKARTSVGAARVFSAARIGWLRCTNPVPGALNG